MIQQLAAANAGMVAFADSGTHAVSVTAQAFAAQLSNENISFEMTDALETATFFDVGTLAITVGAVFTEILSEGLESISFSMTDALETVTATPSESMEPTVAIFTSVS